MPRRQHQLHQPPAGLTGCLLTWLAAHVAQTAGGGARERGGRAGSVPVIRRRVPVRPCG
jgi:hypothetical protein